MPEIALRPATGADCNALSGIALRSKGHWGYDLAFLEACQPALTITPEFLSRHHVVVAQAGSDLAGFYALSHDRPEAQVECCFVDPDRIGQRVGSMLWRDLEAHALATGATGLAVLSDPNAAGFYRRMGMLDAGSEPSDVFGAARPLPVLKKVLQPIATAEETEN